MAFRSSTKNAQVSNAANDPGKPVGTLETDVLIALVSEAADAFGADQLTGFSAPSGWTLIDQGHFNEGGAGTETLYAAYWAIGSVTSTSFTPNTAAITSVVSIHAYNGIVAATPVDQHSNNGNSGATITALGVTTTIKDGMLVVGMCCDAAQTIAAPSAMTLRTQQVASVQGHMTADLQLGAIGATGDKTATILSDCWSSVLVALVPELVLPYYEHGIV